MKKLILSLFMVVSFVFAGAQSIEFESKVVEYGTIEHNADGNREFKFTNNGDQPLVIKSAKGSCGCTVPEWPKEPIAKAEEATIKVTFNSTGRSGKQNKTVTLVTNAIPNTKVITITGNVIIPEKK